MYHPTTRVLTVLELLQAHPRISGREIARRLEVDVRTVRRYIAMLQDIGIPIVAETGRVGGYTLRPGFKLPPLMFTEDEALAVTLGLLAARQLGLVAAAPAVEGAIAKIDRVLPLALRDQVRALHETLILDMAAAEASVGSATLAALATAVHHQRQVKITYQSSNGTSDRRIDPYGVVAHGGRWYTVGYCHLRKAIRIFRLDRILNVEQGDTLFERPANFDVLAYVIRSFETLPDVWDVEVLLGTTLARAQALLPRALGTLQPCDEGVILSTSVSDLDWMARFLLTLACPVIVRKPTELRDAFRRVASEAARIAQTMV